MHEDRDAGSKNMSRFPFGVRLSNVLPLSQSEDKAQQRSGRSFGNRATDTDEQNKTEIKNIEQRGAERITETVVTMKTLSHLVIFQITINGMQFNAKQSYTTIERKKNNGMVFHCIMVICSDLWILRPNNHKVGGLLHWHQSVSLN